MEKSEKVIIGLRAKAEELSGRIANGDGEIMKMMDSWYDTIRELEHFNEHRALVPVSGKDFPMIKDYIDDRCIILIPEDLYENSSNNMRND